MKENLKWLAKRIFLGATAAIAASTVGMPKNLEAKDLKLDDSNSETALKSLKESKTPKLVLMKPTDGTLTSFIFHRSHRSHSSHRSHYSSYTQPSKPKKVETPKQEDNNPGTKKVVNFKLGERNLKKGMEGLDVAELQDSLISKGYELKITAAFDDETEKAVKKFQKDTQIEVNGIVDFVTLYYLKNK